MRLKDRSDLKGTVTITTIDAGVRKVVWHDPNIIVEQGRRHLAYLLSNDSTVIRIGKLSVGTGGHEIGNPNIPIPPSYNDTALEFQTFVKNISSVSYEPSGLETTVVFTTVLNEPEANGPGDSAIQLTEAGLLLSNNVLFARETFVPVIKAPSRRVQFDWAILF